MILVTGSLKARAGSIDAALRLARKHVARSRGEPGFLSHAVHVDADDPARLAVRERWTDMTALRVHLAIAESRDCAKAVADIAAEAPGMQIYDATELRP